MTKVPPAELAEKAINRPSGDQIGGAHTMTQHFER
jgi:hypothetical protein